jgi:hypothetical protein
VGSEALSRDGGEKENECEFETGKKRCGYGWCIGNG